MFLCVILVFSMVIGGSYAPPGGGTKMCYHCGHVKDPARCTELMKCHHGDHTCFTKVELLHGQLTFSKGCTHECQDTLTASVVGKRAGPLPGPLEHGRAHGQIACQKCCDGTQCNKNGCDQYVPTTTRSVAQTTTPTATCRDHEGDGFLCVDYDQYNFCTDTSSLAHKLAVERCPKYCGFCDDNGNFNVNISSITVIDVLPSGQPSTTAALPDKQTQQPITTTTTDAMTTAGQACVDKEDAGFSCQQWSAYGFCSDSTGTGHAIALERCQKTCGFCS